ILVICHPPPGPYAQMVAATAPNRLFHQEADGTFKEVPNAGGLAGKGFHHGVAIGDVNSDGHSDVYVCNYGAPDELFVNNGDGTFTDVTKPAGIDSRGRGAARGWGLICADLTGDGLPDIFQANDEEPNQLWVNQGNGTFLDEGAIRGCAFNARGAVEANMGVTVGDVRHTGNLDLCVTHSASETNTPWQNTGRDGNLTHAPELAGPAMLRP